MKEGNYYDNSDLCPECTGHGCKRCYDMTGLKRTGSIRFPLSHMISGCKPPNIGNNYADKFDRFYRPGQKRPIPHNQRRY